MNAYAKATDQYLVQRVMSASPEQLVAMLLEGGQRFLGLAIQDQERNDLPARANHLGRVLAIIDELIARLNHEDGGEVVVNLIRIYDWWSRELLEGSQKKDAGRLEAVKRQMGEMRETWEQLHQNRAAQGKAEAPALSAEMTG